MISKLEKLSFVKLLCMLLLMVTLFWIAYFVLSVCFPEHGIESTIGDCKEPIGLLNTLYFSIVTVSSLGYGDFRPLGFSRVLANLEVVLGLVFIALVVAKVTSERQSKLTNLLISHTISEKLNGYSVDVAEYAEKFKALHQKHEYEKISSEVAKSRNLLGSIQSFVGYHAYEVETLSLTTSSVLRRLLLSMQKYVENIMVVTRSGVDIDNLEKKKVVYNVKRIKKICMNINDISGDEKVKKVALGVNVKVDDFIKHIDVVYGKHRHKEVTEEFRKRVKSSYNNLSKEEMNSNNVHAILAKKMGNGISNKLVLKALYEIFITKDTEDNLRNSYEKLSGKEKNNKDTLFKTLFGSNEVPNKFVYMALKKLGIIEAASKSELSDKSLETRI